jgi:formate dehydrogenase alpha subunit
VAGLATTFGSGAMTNSIDDISDSRCVLAIGTNTTEAHPIIGMALRRAVRNGSMKLIVANPLEIPLVREAELWLQQRAGTDVVLLMGMAKVIVDAGLADESFIQARTDNFESF